MTDQRKLAPRLRARALAVGLSPRVDYRLRGKMTNGCRDPHSLA